MKWNENGIFYHIYPLGCFGSEDYNNNSEGYNSRILNLNEWIPYLKELGINAIYLGPLFESTSHGYDTRDFFWVDRRLGCNEDLKDVINSCHNNGIKVVLDGVFNHTGREFWAFKDILQNRQSSQYVGWYNINFNNNNGYNDGFSYDGWNGHYNLVKLNLKNPAVINHIFDAVKMWIDYFDIDGIRLDAADSLDFDFIKNLKGVCYAKKNDFWLMAEVIHGDYNRWMGRGTMADSVTNYECYKGLWSAHNDKNYFEIGYGFNRQFGSGGMYRELLYNFVDNHDVNRVASVLKKEEYLYLTYSLLFTMNGNPSIYYGSEIGIKGEKTNNNDKPLRPYIDIATLRNNAISSPLFNYIKKLINIRYNSNALKLGGYRQLHLSLEQFSFLREHNGERVVVALNQSDKDVKIDLNLNGSKMIDVLNNNEEFEIYNNKISLPIYPNCTRILMVKE